MAKQSRLIDLQKKLTPPQVKLLNFFWEYYQSHSKWPTTRLIHSQLGGKQSVVGALRKMSGDVAWENEDHQVDNRYQLTILGVLLTKSGKIYYELLLRYAEFLRDHFYSQPDKLDFSDKDFVEALHLSEAERQLMGDLVDLSQLSRGGSRGPSWSIRVPREIEDFPQKGSLKKVLEDFLFRFFKTNKPVLIEDARKQVFDANAYETVIANNKFVSPIENVASNQTTPSIDPLKRLYQVFVSSTYEDLKEERQHVNQALLETKCIPTGMELFPAASMEQWKLIQRVIDQCDYYLVIVAGRYGSLSEDGISYTEMEFDYAHQIGKPVIGFYHSSVENLPNFKSEKSDKGRKQLKSFLEKVKRRVCRPWNSPAELGSAVKSAILHELEFNRKPGWIRADAVPPSDAVEKMKQRIADLEEKSKKRKTKPSEPSLPTGKQTVAIPIIIKYDYQKVKDEFGFDESIPKKEIEERIVVTWDDIILIWASLLQAGSTLNYLTTCFEKKFENKLRVSLADKIEKNERCSIRSNNEQLESVLKTLMARRLIKMKSKYGSWVDPIWIFTPHGLQYLSGLQAIRSGKGS